MKEKTGEVRTVSTARRAVIGLVLGVLLVYGIIANYREFVLRPKQEAELSEKLAKEQLANDPLFADVRYESDGTMVKLEPGQKSAAKGGSSAPAGANATKKGEPISIEELQKLDGADPSLTSLNLRWVEARIVQDEAHGSLRLGIANNSIHALEMVVAPTHTTSLTVEQLIDGLSEVALRDVRVNERILPVLPLIAEEPERVIETKARAYIQVNDAIERIIVDAYLTVKPLGAEAIQLSYRLERGERPSEGLLIDADADKNYRLYLSGELEVSLLETSDEAPTLAADENSVAVEEKGMGDPKKEQ